MMTVTVEDLRLAATLSKMVYCYPGDYTSPDIHMRSYENAIVLLHIDKYGKLWIVPRGTDDLQDLMDDISCVRMTTNDTTIAVHAGFWRYARYCIKAIAGHGWLHEDREVRIAGHSLGGAAAILMPISSEFVDWVNPRIITFGSPRTFNGSMNPLSYPFHDRVMRIVRPEDLVPDLPLHTKCLTPFTTSVSGWTHVGNDLYLYGGRLTEEGPSRIYNWCKRVGRYCLHLPYYGCKLLYSKMMGQDRPPSLLEQDHSMQIYADLIYKATNV